MKHALFSSILLITILLTPPLRAAEVINALDIAPVWAGHRVGFCLLTHPPHQFAAYYDAERNMTVAARKLDETEWQYDYPVLGDFTESILRSDRDCCRGTQDAHLAVPFLVLDWCDRENDDLRPFGFSRADKVFWCMNCIFPEKRDGVFEKRCNHFFKYPFPLNIEKIL